MHATASPSELSAPSPFVAARGGGSAMEDLIAGRWINKAGRGSLTWSKPLSTSALL